MRGFSLTDPTSHRQPSAPSDAAAAVRLSEEQRRELVEEHLGLVRSLAAKVRRSHNVELPEEELVSFGSPGLVEAAARWDPARGVAFATFAYYRVRGAIFDGLRQLGWLSRREYLRAEAASNAYLQREAEAPSGGSDEPLAGVAGALDGVAAIFVTMVGGVGLDQTVEDTETEDPESGVERMQTRQQVRRAVAGLPQPERQLVEGHYFGGKTLTAVGEELGLSRSWASRLHARAVKLLAEELRALEDG